LGNEEKNILHSWIYGQTAPASQVLRRHTPVTPGTAHRIRFLTHAN